MRFAGAAFWGSEPGRRCNSRPTRAPFDSCFRKSAGTSDPEGRLRQTESTRAMIRRPSSPPKVLLVDDVDDNLLVLEALLQGDDLTLLEARSGREALELLLVHDIALALVDVQMPEMD